ncbi:hypothetical protein NCCP2222_23540 [Sporosarcina sp. NCCP-2222]|uniref:hypothetical protein n=1 Tax=Sporosarcina sp. NCCP-2222 TaxID=2935073 RepID=UPI00208960B9|nr:hypothetical protein [Sporosarcina sp. NCCP-2222]GKV56407.1 hypothetical protein NCCP2222_23540 [Sporosarcina sp. NCCP-2222]
MKRTMLGILVGITVITIIFVVLGYKYDKSDAEKQQGKSGVYDVAADGTIAYVSFANGIAGLFISSDDRLPVVELPVDQTILDLSYSKDGTILAYVVAAKDFEEQSGSTVYLLNTETREEIKTFSTKGLITDLAFDPADPNRLLYLQADSFTNYSPIASKAPHDYDVHSYHFANGITKKHTDMKA